MNIVIIILGILYLCGFNVGVPLAICSIVEGTLIFILNLLKTIQKHREEENKKWNEVFRSRDK